MYATAPPDTASVTTVSPPVSHHGRATTPPSKERRRETPSTAFSPGSPRALVAIGGEKACSRLVPPALEVRARLPGIQGLMERERAKPGERVTGDESPVRKEIQHGAAPGADAARDRIQPIHGTLREHAGHPPTVEAQADPALASQERELGHSAAHFPVVPRAKECVGRPGRRLSQAKPHGPVQTVSIDGVEERIEPNRGRVNRDTEPHPGPEAPADLLESRGFEWPAQQWWHGIEQQRCSGHGQGLELLQGRLRDETAGEQHKAQPARDNRVNDPPN